ncbi:MAG TPA: ribonuclease HII [Candidatus Saccharimonadales bacterium]
MEIGIDEAGRGAWAGPLVCAAVSLDGPIRGLADSKTLARAAREQLADIIQRRARGIGLGIIGPMTIDRLGLAAALKRAFRLAWQRLDDKSRAVVIDGPIDYLGLPHSRAIIRADGQIPAVMAASVIAKVTRDKIMFDQTRRWPNFGFDSHVGYGTKRHRQAIDRHGLTSLHRRSFRPMRQL